MPALAIEKRRTVQGCSLRIDKRFPVIVNDISYTISGIIIWFSGLDSCHDTGMHSDSASSQHPPASPQDHPENSRHISQTDGISPLSRCSVRTAYRISVSCGPIYRHKRGIKLMSQAAEDICKRSRHLMS